MFAVTIATGAACGEADLGPAGAADGGARPDAAPTSLDASVAADADTPRDGGPPPCAPLAPSTDPMHAAAVTGRVDVVDYDFWDETRAARDRVRNAGLNFLTATLPVRPPVDGPFFTGIAPDQCITIDIPNAAQMLGPPRNVGVRLTLADEAGLVARFDRRSSGGQLEYRASTQAELVRFFDRAATPLGRTYTWSTEGDPGARISAAVAVVAPVEDFEVTPAITSTDAPMRLDLAAGSLIEWTAPATTAAALTITLSRALNPEGDGRYVICRPIDDGSFTIPAAAIASIGATPGLAFGLDVARAAVAPFCNEGVTAGAITHALVYTGRAVVP